VGEQKKELTPLPTFNSNKNVESSGEKITERNINTGGEISIQTGENRRG